MRLVAVFLVAALAAAPAAAQQAVSLKWNLKEGDKFFAKSDTDMDTSMTLMGQNLDVNMSVHSVQLFKVLAVKQDATTVELTIQRMEMKSVPAIPMLGAIGDRMKGATVTAVLDKDMKVTKIEGYKAFMDKIAGEDDRNRKLIKGMMSEPAVRQMFTDVFSFGPDKTVKVGDDWTRKEKMAVSLLDTTINQKYKLESVADGVAKIAYKADVEFKPGGGLPGLPGLEGVKVDSFDMKAEKFSGTLRFDTNAGRLIGGTQEATMTGSMSTSVAGQKLDVGMKIKMKSETTISEKNPAKD